MYAPNGWIIPFQIKTPNNSTGIHLAQTVNVETGATLDITGLMTGEGLEHVVYPERTYNAVRYKAITNVDVIPKGFHYLELTVNVGEAKKTYYSEVFNVVDNRGFMRLSFWHNEDFELPNFHFSFPEGWKFFAFLKTELGKPEYLYEDFIHRRDGYNFAEKIVSVKRYRFEVLAGEPMWDGLRLARLFNFITIQSGIRNFPVYELELEVEWEETGYTGIGTFTADTGNVVISTGKGRALAGDFDESFNKDFT